jgi:hypothetical protein
VLRARPTGLLSLAKRIVGDTNGDGLAYFYFENEPAVA